jgi:hypothetical protein
MRGGRKKSRGGTQDDQHLPQSGAAESPTPAGKASYIYLYIYCGRRQGGVRGLGIERRHLATCWLHPQALHGLPPINEAGLKAIKLECLLLKKESATTNQS